MSKNYVKAVLDHLPALTSPTETLVLLALAERASDETRSAWPSLRELVKRTRLTRFGIQKALRRLEAKGLIAVAIGGQVERVDSDGRRDLINASSDYRLEFDHDGRSLKYAGPPKRGFKAVSSVAERKPPAPAPTPTKAQNVTPSPRPAVKKIPTAEPARDLTAEKQRQLAAIKQKLRS